MNNERVFAMAFSKVYPLYIQKAEKKGRTQEEVDEIIFWLTGYSHAELNQLIEANWSIREFFDKSPEFNKNASKISGVICGYRVEDIQDPLMQKVRYLDKLIDELAKGKSLEKIKRN